MAVPLARTGIVLLVVATGVLAQANSTEMTAKPEGVASCWDCHRVIQGNAGPIQTLLDLAPPASAGAPVGQPFDYPIVARNAWSHQQNSLRVTLDLTQAPSLGFASDVARLEQTIADAIPVNALAVAEHQHHAVPVTIPDGETHLEVVLQPGPQDDLALLVHPPLYPPSGPAYARLDAGRRGEAETFTLANRTTFSALGYGEWTFVIEGRILPDPITGTGGAVPNSDQTLPFTLDVQAYAEATADRISSAVNLERVPAGASVSVPFRLVAVAPPSAGETVALRADLWAHYDHASDANDDDENVTKVHASAILVTSDGAATHLVTEAGPHTTVLRPLNGPTLATVSEAVGYAAAFLLVASIVSGGMFGKASRRGLNAVFGTAKRRVAFHNFLSYGILLAAAVHTVLFVVEASYHWTLGMIWGGAGIVALLLLGVTGALQVPLIRRWGYAGWRWTHFGLAGASILFAVLHGLLDGVHFAAVQNALGWSNPFDPSVA